MSKTKKDPKFELINEIIQLTKVREEYWSYHPSNPNKIDIDGGIKEIDKLILSLEKQIKNLDNG